MWIVWWSERGTPPPPEAHAFEPLVLTLWHCREGYGAFERWRKNATGNRLGSFIAHSTLHPLPYVGEINANLMAGLPQALAVIPSLAVYIFPAMMNSFNGTINYTKLFYPLSGYWCWYSIAVTELTQVRQEETREGHKYISQLLSRELSSF